MGVSDVRVINHLHHIEQHLDVMAADVRLSRVDRELERELAKDSQVGQRRIEALEKQREALLSKMGIARGRAS